MRTEMGFTQSSENVNLRGNGKASGLRTGRDQDWCRAEALQAWSGPKTFVPSFRRRCKLQGNVCKVLCSLKIAL